LRALDRGQRLATRGPAGGAGLRPVRDRGGEPRLIGIVPRAGGLRRAAAGDDPAEHGPLDAAPGGDARMTVTAVLFWLVAGVVGGSALMVVLTQNIVRAAAWLLFTLAGTAALYFLLAADFVGATQLIVYVGGTLVLVVFGVMLTAQGPFLTMKAGAGEWAVATVVGILFFGVLAATASFTIW